MQDIRNLRDNFEATKAKLDKRGKDYNLEAFHALDLKRRELLKQSEDMKAKQNAASKQIPVLKKEGKDTTSLMAEMKTLSDQIKAFEPEVKDIDDQLAEFMMGVANTPHESVPDGKDSEDNVEVRRVGTPPVFDFEPLPHWEIGVNLKIFDPETAVKIAGSRFTMMRGLGARMERALVQLMLDRHTENGYEEISPPVIAHRRSMEGVGQLPDKEGQLFHLEDTEYFLIPTAETPLTNIHREEILEATDLPIKFTAFTPSFRKEAGAAGRDTRGLIRMHQFPKVEIVKLTKPEDSYAELESLTADAENILKELGLPYRVVNLCAGDLGFSNAKTYDLEVWMPSYGKYVEVSSCSNFEAFQARRAQIRYKDENGKNQFVHTLNGSGLGVNRTLAAIMENFQQADGSIVVPEVLRKWMGCDVIK